MNRPKFDLEVYRQFIREAAPYVSVVIGRRIQAAEANLLTDDQLVKIALIIDDRVKDLKPLPGSGEKS